MQAEELLASHPGIIGNPRESGAEHTIFDAWLGYTGEIELLPREHSTYYDIRIREVHVRAEPGMCRAPDYSFDTCTQQLVVSKTIDDYPLPYISN